MSYSAALLRRLTSAAYSMRVRSSLICDAFDSITGRVALCIVWPLELASDGWDGARRCITSSDYLVSGPTLSPKNKMRGKKEDERLRRGGMRRAMELIEI